MRESVEAEWHTLSRSSDQTEAIGAALSAAIPPLQSAPGVLYLVGDLGAGKTTLVRGFLRRRGVAGVVQSPTFTLLECYELPDIVVVHLDLYRLREPGELEMLGLRDLARPAHVWLIEWPERGRGHLPCADLQLELRVADEGHPIQLAAHTPRGGAWLAGAVELLRAST
ncbi:MAG TPA: tRNA (adenosine(37)-N6)-threonylcarbamoyltransferase complex ATPase subunit type 1 TsaE [Steroidobacteraceae bacterium]|nr:tRNA (adenosine(37)-N6)-threonylcarbamoyltransferase complex ATPase subunit type 1 TsaE [Steroidobacteraceae bacterium]